MKYSWRAVFGCLAALTIPQGVAYGLGCGSLSGAWAGPCTISVNNGPGETSAWEFSYKVDHQCNTIVDSANGLTGRIGAIFPQFQSTVTFRGPTLSSPSHYQVNAAYFWDPAKNTLNHVWQTMDGDDVLPAASVSASVRYSTSVGSLTVLDDNTLVDHWESDVHAGMVSDVRHITLDCKLTRQGEPSRSGISRTKLKLIVR
jgi:hypothetical protein